MKNRQFSTRALKMNELFREKELTTRVCLTPDELGSDYRETIFGKVTGLFENTCMVDIGYIARILSLEKIHHEEVMRMLPSVFLLVSIRVLAYLPKPADVLDLQVEFIFKNGVFGRFHKIQCLVPAVSWDGWELRQDFSGTFLYHPDDEKSIRKGDVVPVVLRTIRFEKDVFSCIAKIK